uniref:Uncharacterized protein n=1 Tax=Arundo donax TaxID=35708 RepID=A0A0A9EJQ4_ARUDO
MPLLPGYLQPLIKQRCLHQAEISPLNDCSFACVCHCRAVESTVQKVQRSSSSEIHMFG